MWVERAYFDTVYSGEWLANFGKTTVSTFMAEVSQVGLLSDQAMGIQKVSPKSRGNVRDHDMGTFQGGLEMWPWADYLY
jgi:hypothetical protein